ncbi:HAMP domain-containing sensor histidine kinase [Nocardia cyriacigeorgica]|uniref:sensor histidine kinase n=2 Tax=Nocardia cyriacigeorgica TaxID=135487 RepID=UPI00313C5F7A
MALVLSGIGVVTVRQARDAADESVTDGPSRALIEAMITDLRGELLLAFPLIWILATAGAFLLATAALRPVERMRARAAQLRPDDPDPYLPIPDSDDEIARLGTTFNDLLARLHDALDRERRFVADAGHELRTPLSLLTTELELALRAPRGNTELIATVRAALDDTNRLSRLAQDLLLLARSSDDDSFLTGDTHQLHPLLAAITDRYPDPIGLDCPPRLSVRVDPDRFERAIGNLIDNALDYGLPPIHLTAAQHDSMVTITVRDHGPGFPPEFLPHALDRFTRADAARTRGGNGLGLSIVAAIAARHHGRVHAANHPDGGAVVTVELPAVADLAIDGDTVGGKRRKFMLRSRCASSNSARWASAPLLAAAMVAAASSMYITTIW